MALEGTLKDFSLADIFQLIGLQRKTGVLTLRGKDDTVTVTFLDGKVVSADSLNRRLENRLGHVLIKTGTLTPEQLNRALEIQRETLQRLGFILTHYGIISHDELRRALQLQILQIIYRLFRWKDGDYHFSQETTIEYDRENVVPITAESVLMEGARMIDEWPIIEKKIRSYDMIFRRRDLHSGAEVVVADREERDFDTSGTRRKKPSAAGTITISPDENAVYELVDGRRSVADIVEASRLSEFDTNKALFELANQDLIEELRESSPQLVVEEIPDVGDEPEEQPAVPLPLVAGLTVLVLLSLATLQRNPLNSTSPFSETRGMVSEAMKAVSFQRIRTLGAAVDAYHLMNGEAPERLAELTPHWIGNDLLDDPWGNAYKYLRPPGKYLVVGFTREGRADTDLFFSQALETGMASSRPTQPTGGIVLID
jgi:hypothetical protein